MALKESGNVTVTLRCTTVSKLRALKGAKTWDNFLSDLVLIKRQGARAECMVCGKTLETEDIYLSSSVLAEKNGWSEVMVKFGPSIGFLCFDCNRERRKKESEKEKVTLKKGKLARKVGADLER